jgi:hypothetical protein
MLWPHVVFNKMNPIWAFGKDKELNIGNVDDPPEAKDGSM